MLNSYLKRSSYYLTGCLIVFLAYLLIKQFPYLSDLTQNKQRTLSQPTVELLNKVSAPIQLTLYSNNIEKMLAARSLVALYQQYHVVEFKQVNPMGADRLKITLDKKSQEVPLLTQELTEKMLTQALFEAYQKENQWVAFLQGHGEPSPFSKQNTDFSWFTQALNNQGFKAQALSLYDTQLIPENTQLLVIANPKTELLPKERALIRNYIQKGHALLWLSGPDETPSLSPLLTDLGLEKLPGTVVEIDEKTQEARALSTIDNYPLHETTQTAYHPTIFPEAAAFKIRPVEAQQQWQITPILTTKANAWTEKADILTEPLQFNRQLGEVPGPLNIGFALNRPKQQGGSQKIVIIGTAQFLNNANLVQEDNLNFALNLSTWLSRDAALITFPTPVANDLSLTFTPVQNGMREYGFKWIAPSLILLGLFAYQFRRYTQSLYYSRVIKR